MSCHRKGYYLDVTITDADQRRHIAAWLLRVDVDASADELKLAYRRAVKRSHPDLFPEAERTARARTFNGLTVAYELLCDRAPRRTRPVLAIEPRRISAAEARFRNVLISPVRGGRFDLAA